MEKIKIITDSTVDLPKELLRELDVEVLPVLINFGEESYLDGIEINRDEVFRRIDNGDVFPTTAQIVPNRFVETYEKYLNQGYKVLAVLMSSGMSGTYQSACLAKQMLETEDVQIVDSQTITSGLGVLVLQAARLRDKGLTIEEIAKELEEIKPYLRSCLSFDSLDNLVKGGRLPKAVSVVTGMLGIKLVLEVKDGVISLKGKVRGSKKAVKKIISDMEEFGIRKDIPVIIANVNHDEVCNGLKEYLEEHNIDYIEGPVGCSVGIHSGDRALGVFFISEKL
ncbi:EDD, DegV family domain protein [Clostridium baratii str. Sullivan]|uniref:EDD, DegV family domain protein n=1 Tax=Clostridium baratii str. Sullivan TaxID=1415775 RepID=A0A0A7FTJ8_9CLOT|nr:DegV family protein [Clostridium baratii]AIY82932.1 EDD, DegV family domain protein [Clostridium baratii str. Sullivan]